MTWCEHNWVDYLSTERYAVERGFSGPPVLRKARLSGLRHARRFPARAGKYFLRKPLTNRDPP
jgi:hypothetical protein